MLNKVMLIGRSGKEPELRTTQAGVPIVNLNIATSESYTDRDGNKVDRTEWHRVVAFQRLAEVCNEYVAKGSLVYIEGSLQTRKWQDQQGQDRYTTEIRAHRVQFLSRKTEQATEEAHTPAAGATATAALDATYDDLGPAFPSETNGMDDMPF